MEKKISLYETLFALNGNLNEEDYQALKEKFVALINENATEVNVAEWGKRRFAYPVNDVNDGYYVLATFKSEPNFPAELTRVFGITEGVLRYNTIAKDEKKAAKACAVAAPVEEKPVEEAPAEENAEG